MANPRVVQQMENTVTQNNPNLTAEQVNQQVYQLVLRDNYFNAVMDLVSSCYQFELSEDEIRVKSKNLIDADPELTPDVSKQIVSLNIKRELIFEDIAKSLRIIVSDDQVKKTLDQYYENTGKPIREFLASRDRFNEVRKTLTDQLISERLMNAFRADFQLDEFNQRMQAQAAEQQQQQNSTAPKSSQDVKKPKAKTTTTKTTRTSVGSKTKNPKSN